MEITRIHIDNFGKIHDLTLDFHEGINVIKQPNAWGKSTLAAFIKAMFYGLESKKVSELPERERAFYNPWQGGVFGGELDFTANGRSYRISRTFGQTEKKDVCHVYDLATNLESVDFNGNIGEILFDLDSNSFKRSVFIAQNDCESQTSDAINAKLGNLAANTNDINNYETAQDSLKAVANALTPNRATGSLKRRKKLITEMEEELRGYAGAAMALDELTGLKKKAEEEKDALSASREELATQLKVASEESGRKQRQKQYLDICSEMVAKLEALNAFAGTFPVGVPDEAAFKDVIAQARSLEENKLRAEHLAFTDSEKAYYDRLEGMFEKGIPTDIEIDAAIANYGKLAEVKENKTRLDTSLLEREKKAVVIDPLPEQPKKTNGLTAVGIILAILGILAFAGALYMFVALKYPPYYMFAGVVLLVIATILFIAASVKQKRLIHEYDKALEEYKQRQQEEMDEITAIKDQALGTVRTMKGIEDDTKGFLEKYQVFCGPGNYASALYELKSQVKDYHRLRERVREKDEVEFEGREIRNRIVEFAAEWKLEVHEDLANELIMLQTEAAKYRVAEAESKRVLDRKNEFEATNDMDDLEKVTTAEGTLDEINAGIANYDEQIEVVRTSIEQYARQIEDLKVELDALDEKKDSLKEYQLTQEAEQHKFNIVTKTQEYLKNAREQFTAKYMAPISNAFRKYYEILNQSDNDGWMIDANVELKKREMGELREVSHLSAGYQDLIGVCMRLALVDAMYQDEKPFLVLDDPFVNLDEEKTVKGMELLDFVANEYQTIYFTCHNSRTP